MVGVPDWGAGILCAAQRPKYRRLPAVVKQVFCSAANFRQMRPYSPTRGVDAAGLERREPPLDPPQPAIERRHRPREVRRIVALPDPHRRQIGRRGQLDRQGAAHTRRLRCRPLRASTASSAAARPATQAPSPDRRAIRAASTARAGLYGRSASNRRINRSNSRSRGRSSSSAAGGSASTASSIRRNSPRKDRLLRRKAAVDAQNRQPGLGGDRGERQPPPPILRDAGERGVDDPVGFARAARRRHCGRAWLRRRSAGALRHDRILRPLRLSSPIRASAPPPRRPPARSAATRPSVGHQHIERGARRAAGAGHVLAQLRRALVGEAGQLARPGDGAAGETQGKLGRQPRRFARPAPAPRSAERHRPGRCRKPRSPRRAAPRPRPRRFRRRRRATRRRAARCAGVTRALAQATVIPRPIAAGVFGIARTSAAGPRCRDHSGRSSCRRRSRGTACPAPAQRR